MTPEKAYAALCAARPGNRDWPSPESSFGVSCIAALSAVGGEKKKKGNLSDEEWVISLEGEPSLHGINIRREIGKCQFWCKTNKKLPTRRRIVNWLNKAERVVDLKAGGAQYATGLRPVPPVQPEPSGWRDTFPDFVDVGKPWASLRPEQRAFILTELTAQYFSADIKADAQQTALRHA